MLALLLAFGVSTAAPPDHERVRVDVGGVMSGPDRLEVDLTTGVARRAALTDGRHGDSAGVFTSDLPVVSTRKITAAESTGLRALGEAVLKEGFNGPGRCDPQLDYIVSMTVSLHGETKTEFLYCGGSQAASRLDRAISCATDPSLEGCHAPPPPSDS